MTIRAASVPAVTSDQMLTFCALQSFDLLTTLAGFRLGSYELNPLLCRFFFPAFGIWFGLVVAKIAMSSIMFGWMLWRPHWSLVNRYFHILLVWNTIMIVGQAARHYHLI